MPEGENTVERVAIWLTRAPKIGEHMIWVGKDYSLAQLKADVREILNPQDKGVDYHAV
jgi:hypothetical protein